MEYLEYKTQSYERWDTIAYKFYGNMYKIKDLTDANPDVIIDTHIPPGTTLKIPIEENKTITDDSLPPWKK